MEPRPATPTGRFPTLRVAACGAGFLAAAYIWLGWGWRWDVTPEDILEGPPPVPFPGGWAGRYVRLHARAFYDASYLSGFRPARLGRSGEESASPWWRRKREAKAQEIVLITRLVAGIRGEGRETGLFVLMPDKKPDTEPNERFLASRDFRGRLVWDDLIPLIPVDGMEESLVTIMTAESHRALVLDPDGGRWVGMSLIALVVAFWTAVFLWVTVAGWRRARRRFELLSSEKASHAAVA